jgi:hypothetical protein
MTGPQRFVLVLAAAALVLTPLPHLFAPPSHEELQWWIGLARALLADGRFVGLGGEAWSDHPPLYGLILAAALALGDGQPWAGRVVGIAAALGTLAAAVAAARRLAVAHGAPPWLAPAAAVTIALHPVIAQGALVLEPDTTLAPLLAALLALVAVRADLFTTGRALGGAAVVAALLATKLYQAIPPLVALAAVAGVRPAFKVGAGGVALFAAVMLPVTLVLGMTPSTILAYPFAAAATRGGRLSAGALAESVFDAGTVALWLSPALVAAAVLALRDRRPAVRFLALWGVVHVAISTLAIGALYGFPKYGAAAVPALVLAALAWLGTIAIGRRTVVTAAALALVAGAAASFVLGDPLLAARVGVKLAALEGAAPLREAALAVLATTAAIVLAPAALALALVRGPWRARAAGALVAGHVCLVGLLASAQVRADYATGFGYGERGLADVVALVRADARPGRVVALLPVTDALGAPPMRVGRRFWNGDDGALHAAIQEPGTCCVVESLGQNTVAQLRYFTGTLAPAATARGFRLWRGGTYVALYRPRTPRASSDGDQRTRPADAVATARASAPTTAFTGRIAAAPD